MPLLDEKCARAGLELFLDESELAMAETEAHGIFLWHGIRVRKENLRRSLFDDGATDGTLEHVTRTLRREAHDTVELSPGLGAVLGEALEGRILEQPPELVHPANEPATIQHLAHQVEEIHRDGCANDDVVEKF